jgi:hypothetical protein
MRPSRRRGTRLFAGQIEGEVLGGFGAASGSLFEGDVADVEGALEVLGAVEEAFAPCRLFLALEPAVDEGLGGAAALHVGDDLGAGEGLAAVGDEFVEVFVGAGHVEVSVAGVWVGVGGGIEEGNLVVPPAAPLRPSAEWSPS